MTVPSKGAVSFVMLYGNSKGTQTPGFRPSRPGPDEQPSYRSPGPAGQRGTGDADAGGSAGSPRLPTGEGWRKRPAGLASFPRWAWRKGCRMGPGLARLRRRPPGKAEGSGRRRTDVSAERGGRARKVGRPGRTRKRRRESLEHREGEAPTTACGGNLVGAEVNRNRADAAVTQPRQLRLRIGGGPGKRASAKPGAPARGARDRLRQEAKNDSFLPS